ncbi:hypothetical protein E2C01_072382 [Portunus trituberculatus]|uniref:Uncharacterized protein n=1 Tax=Portunus trituberculatus TaxID=210409 RepID=A0A5B7I6J8_PORTR|nr:hypothetical protein [Portunus trituberculatus]
MKAPPAPSLTARTPSAMPYTAGGGEGGGGRESMVAEDDAQCEIQALGTPTPGHVAPQTDRRVALLTPLLTFIPQQGRPALQPPLVGSPHRQG